MYRKAEIYGQARKVREEERKREEAMQRAEVDARTTKAPLWCLPRERERAVGSTVRRQRTKRGRGIMNSRMELYILNP